MRAYFPSIDHAILKALLSRRFKDPGVLQLLERVIDSHHEVPGRGLPIGALTSQHFANWYLDGLDRLLLEQCRVGGLVRYMDDVIWWCDSRTRVREVLEVARCFLRDRLQLEVKPTVQLHRSSQGVRVCGYRVLPGTILMSARRRRRYARQGAGGRMPMPGGRSMVCNCKRGTPAPWLSRRTPMPPVGGVNSCAGVRRTDAAKAKHPATSFLATVACSVCACQYQYA